MERIAMRGPCTLRKRDVTRAIQAVIAAGIEGRIEDRAQRQDILAAAGAPYSSPQGPGGGDNGKFSPPKFRPPPCTNAPISINITRTDPIPWRQALRPSADRR
jgi:hypothetical protein